MLEGRKVPAGQLDSALALAERSEQFAKQMGGFSGETAWTFSRRLIAEGQASLGISSRWRVMAYSSRTTPSLSPCLSCLMALQHRRTCTGGSRKDMTKACGTKSLPAFELHPLAFPRRRNRVTCNR